MSTHHHLAVEPVALHDTAARLDRLGDELLARMASLKLTASAADGTLADHACQHFASELVSVTLRCAEAIKQLGALLSEASVRYADTDDSVIGRI